MFVTIYCKGYLKTIMGSIQRRKSLEQVLDLTAKDFIIVFLRCHRKLSMWLLDRPRTSNAHLRHYPVCALEKGAR